MIISLCLFSNITSGNHWRQKLASPHQHRCFLFGTFHRSTDDSAIFLYYSEFDAGKTFQASWDKGNKNWELLECSNTRLVHFHRRLMKGRPQKFRFEFDFIQHLDGTEWRSVGSVGCLNMSGCHRGFIWSPDWFDFKIQIQIFRTIISKLMVNIHLMCLHSQCGSFAQTVV